MSKSILALTACALVMMLVAPSVSAQDVEMPACSAEEIDAVAAALDIYSEGLAGLGEISLDPNEAAYGAVVVGYDAFSYVFWDTLYPEVPQCTEAQIVALTFGLAYDELTLAASFANIAGWAVALEDAEAAEYFAEVASVRAEAVTTSMEELQTMTAAELLGADMVACSTEEYDSNSAALEEYFTGMGDVLVGIQDLASSDLEAQAATVVVASELSDLYWDEVYPELPACAEAELEAYLAGLVVDEVVLITSLELNATLEAAAGNADVSALMTESAEARYADLTEFLGEMEAMVGE